VILFTTKPSCGKAQNLTLGVGLIEEDHSSRKIRFDKITIGHDVIHLPCMVGKGFLIKMSH
jgi:hypothetical protein